jgi:hypothetical protein
MVNNKNKTRKPNFKALLAAGVAMLIVGVTLLGTVGYAYMYMKPDALVTSKPAVFSVVQGTSAPIVVNYIPAAGGALETNFVWKLGIPNGPGSGVGGYNYVYQTVLTQNNAVTSTYNLPATLTAGTYQVTVSSSADNGAVTPFTVIVTSASASPTPTASGHPILSLDKTEMYLVAGIGAALTAFGASFIALSRKL